MPALFFYLLKLSSTLAILWLFYYAVLRRLTFYHWNRWYLLGYSLLSFVIPLIDIGSFIAPIKPDGRPLSIYFANIPTIANYSPAVSLAATPHPGMNPWDIGFLVLATGTAWMLTRTLIRWASLTRIRRRSQLISDNRIRIYEVNERITPFSFGNAVYINPRLHSEKEWEEIILHEYVHIRQRHTLDILLAEAITIVNWYNPFAWTLRHSIRQNLEFIADQKVLDNGIDKKGYQYHLLQVVGHSRYRLANNFNFSSLKKRIIMMNKIRSARLHLLRFLFLLPLLTVLLLAFRDRYPNLLQGSNNSIFINAAGIVISLPDKTPLDGVTVREISSGLQTTTDAKGFFKFRIPVTANSVRIHLEYTKAGYDTSFNERVWRTVKATCGLIDVAAISTLAPHKQEFFFTTSGFRSFPVEPGYKDASRELERVFTENQQYKHMQQLEKEHPEIALFYATESKQQRLVIHTDGTVERFGYSGSPALAEMDRKYGTLPWFGPEGANTNKGYLQHWAAISAQAEKEFKPVGGNPRAIFFPGDSRVIAVDPQGKARIFDMDNTRDPNERQAFEQIYGKLPPCVPEKGTVPPVVLPKPISQATALQDTTPVTALANALYLLDGIQKEHWTKDSMPDPHTIASVEILGPAEGYRLFGEKGSKGVVAILTKEYANGTTRPRSVRISGPTTDGPVYFIDGKRVPDGINLDAILRPDSISYVRILKAGTIGEPYGPEAATRGAVFISTKNHQNSSTPSTMPTLKLLQRDPLIVLDGKPIPHDDSVLAKLNPDDIESMTVLKDSSGKALYGDKARNGAVLVTTKKSRSGAGN